MEMCVHVCEWWGLRYEGRVCQCVYTQWVRDVKKTDWVRDVDKTDWVRHLKSGMDMCVYVCVNMRLSICEYNAWMCVYILSLWHWQKTQWIRTHWIRHLQIHMGWLRLVGSSKLQVSFAEYRLFYRALLQKRPIILRSLLVEATPYGYMCMGMWIRGWRYVSTICQCVCIHWVRDWVRDIDKTHWNHLLSTDIDVRVYTCKREAYDMRVKRDP